jgi:restriction system protein
MEFLEYLYTNNYKNLDEWIQLIKKGENVYPRFRIPYQDWLDTYLENIADIDEEEVITLLRLLLQPFTRVIDIANYKAFYKASKDTNNLENKNKEMLRIYDSRLKCEKYKRIENGQEAWEGLTWVLQFLPFGPFKAIKALSSYLEAEVCFLPDDRIIGVEQCIDIIEAKYINNSIGLEKYILNLKPRESLSNN